MDFGVSPVAMLNYNDSTFRINSIARGFSEHVVELELLDGEWPHDEEDIITLADGNVPPLKRHFGGFVRYISPRLKKVTVWVD